VYSLGLLHSPFITNKTSWAKLKKAGARRNEEVVRRENKVGVPPLTKQ